MRVLIKFSGEALKKDDKVFDADMLHDLALQVKSIVKEKIGVGIVIGGGNIARGAEFEKLGFDRVHSDVMGMVATALNCQALAQALNQVKVKAVVMSSVACEGAEEVDIDKARELIEKGTVVLFGGGLGHPYLTTDTTCALRAIEIKADKILMAKNGTKGVYDKDPNKFKDAKMYKTITFDEILAKKLKVMDSTAACLCRDNNVNAIVFDAKGKDSLLKAAQGKMTGTVIKA